MQRKRGRRRKTSCKRTTTQELQSESDENHQESSEPTVYAPGLLHQFLFGLLAGNGGHVASWRALDGRVGDVADGQEVGPQSPHAQLGHVGERLADAAAEQEAAQLLVEAGHVEVADKGPRVHAAEADPVALAQRDLTRSTGGNGVSGRLAAG